jgi:WD40 repeat protein/tRNA A-37 threonylcarbamoyl transferase component Bud32
MNHDKHLPTSGGDSGEVKISRTQRIDRIAEWLLDELHAGRAPSIERVLAENSDLADELEPRLQVMLMFQRVAVSDPGGSLAETSFDLRAPCDTEDGRDGKRIGPTRTTLDRMPPPTDGPAIGRYIVLGDPIGRGASGEVFQAFDPVLQRTVAIKLIREAHGENPQFRERFLRDARIAAQFQHPNIVRVHEADEDAGRLFIVMELVRGGTLEDWLRRAPGLHHAERDGYFVHVAGVVRKLAEALDYAHALKVFHRDVKPSNVLIDERGEPLLADFGLARHEGVERSITAEGQIVGTPHYMSPEQAQGRAVDGRSDVYSLGVVLYRMLAGRVPFSDCTEVLPILQHISNTEPPSPRSLNSAVPRDLETICQRAMAKHPDDRFRSAAALAEELRRWLADEPLTIRPPTIWERARRWSRRNRLATRVAAAAAVLLVALGGTLGSVAWVQHKRAFEQRVQQIAEAQTRAEVQCMAFIDSARRIAASPTHDRRAKAQQALREAISRKLELHDKERREQLDIEIRSMFAETLDVPELEEFQVAQLPYQFPLPWRAAIHPSGESIVVATHLGPMRFRRGQELAKPDGLLPNKGRARLAFSPDGHVLAYAPDTGGLVLWDESVTRIIGELRPADTTPVLAIGFSDDYSVIWSCDSEGVVRGWSLDTFQPRGEWNTQVRAARDRGDAGSEPQARVGEAIPDSQSITAAAIGAGGARVATGDGIGRVRWYEADGKLLHEVDTVAPIEALAWSADGRMVSFGSRDGTVQVWTADGAPLHRLVAAGDGVSNIVFHPGGRWLVTAGRSADMRVWDLASGRQVLRGVFPPWGFSRDGEWLAGSGDGGTKWNAGAAFVRFHWPTAFRHLAGHRAQVERIAWAKDGQRLVSIDNTFMVRVWDIARELELRRFAHPFGRQYAGNAGIALSDDGELFASAGGELEEGSVAFIHSVQTGEELGRWRLPRALGDRIAYAGAGRFVLVRDEAIADESKQFQTVVYELAAGQVDRVSRRVLRAGRDDERGNFETDMTPDGKYFLWIGPRVPLDAHRTEIYEVASGRLVTRIPQPTTKHREYLAGLLSPDGRFFNPSDSRDVIDLSRNEPPSQIVADLPRESFIGMSSAARWMLFNGDSAYGLGITDSIRLRRWLAPRTWIQFVNHDLDNQSAATFSRDSRYLAWGKGSGEIIVADIDELEREIAQFEKPTN